MSNDVLRECPLCGGEAWLSGFDTERDAWGVRCLECWAQVWRSDSPQSTIAAWNRRAVEAASPAAPGPAVIEAIRKMAIEYRVGASVQEMDDANLVLAWLRQIEGRGGDA